MWDPFMATSRNLPASTYGFQFRNRHQEVDPGHIHVHEASSNYTTYSLVIETLYH